MNIEKRLAELEQRVVELEKKAADKATAQIDIDTIARKIYESLVNSSTTLQKEVRGNE
ncbi:hypothetical protein [Anoxybacillus ayderensis]|jgi:BMFP domain-containing protein YqiC|uniref:hypothetical protein n=1 Tax=Anoxybacillus ayderensis TaxID=265546 RepID=UPI002E1FE2B3|nr:hypothetical protein [Anoxybacillus ayderensis]